MMKPVNSTLLNVPINSENRLEMLKRLEHTKEQNTLWMM